MTREEQRLAADIHRVKKLSRRALAWEIAQAEKASAAGDESQEDLAYRAALEGRAHRAHPTR